MSKHDFDFLLGDWDAEIRRYAPDGTVTADTKGSWHARASFGGKVIEDQVVQLDADGNEDVAANSLRTYCEETQQWEMVYFWSDHPMSSLMAFVGNRVGDEMHLNLQQLGANGLVTMAQIRFFEIAEHSFSWENNTSIDNGRSWFISGSHRMRRRVSSA